jgi:peptide deformylase
MQALDLSGEPFEQVGSGFITRIWQHENDHLNGILILDRMGAVAKLTYRKRLKELEDEYATRQAEEAKRKKRPPGTPLL